MNDKIKGRGAQFNPDNPYLGTHFTTNQIEGLDEDWKDRVIKTRIIEEYPKEILSKNSSPDLPFTYSLNPYQGCEHGCIYCYARNAHHYWGLGAGLDFESKIIVKKNAASLLEKTFLKKSWKPQSIMLSGNTDCYQPTERKLKITRGVLEVLDRYKNPVGVITKNALLLRDADILKSLAEDNLVKVFITITTLNEDIRRNLEPRASSFHKRLKIIEKLAEKNIPTGVMIGPVIPGLTEHELPTILREASNAGASGAGYTVLRLNGVIGQIFEHWLDLNYPNSKDKILNKVKAMHGGAVNDSDWGRRLRGEGNYAKTISSLFERAKNKYFKNKGFPETNLNAFRKQGNLNLF